ncbi:membrane protein [Mycobacterium phage Aminay]|uniref:Membrane protein n=1 Tax=Mycobacterium phage Aminay TaxID=2250291 RepID=A0A345KV23_9CAUD|nr:membrane protein [Mycobacterium phage Aminay]AXH46875.1 membrane protein [Mycobacterium phage Aminay]
MMLWWCCLAPAPHAMIVVLCVYKVIVHERAARRQGGK